jgi:hypothetical protein
MQETIWNDKESPQPTNKQSPHTSESSVMHTAQDCLTYGHDWQTTEIQGAKQCKACGVTGYCPGCTSNPKPGTLPFYCTAHTRIESTPVQE